MSEDVSNPTIGGAGNSPDPTSNLASPDGQFATWTGMLDAKAGQLLFPQFANDPELGRRARLITRFGFLGFLFGMPYAAFYLFIGHYWGAGIIVVCSVAYGITPFIIKVTQSLRLPGNLLSGIMAGGFSGLCLVEEGMHGHAIAWLASVPLCALLLVDRKAAHFWAAISFLCGAAIVGANFLGIKFPNTFDASWIPVITAAGYLGLIAFMFLLGVIFETSRERAFTRMREALKKLEASNQQLVHLNNEKNEFLGIAAHDLKNPLTAVIGNAELITMFPHSANATKLAENICTAGKRMRDLITNLLDANAIEQGRFTSNIERCDFSLLVEQSVEHNASNARRKEIAIKLDAAPGVWAMADANATLQILDNLISNAIKYSPPKSSVEIRTSLEQGQAVAWVKDSGPGLSADDQKKLFQKFTRLSAKPTGGESSNGLGLSIVKRLAEAMNGTVRCESVFGDGAVFIVGLPAVVAEQQSKLAA